MFKKLKRKIKRHFLADWRSETSYKKLFGIWGKHYIFFGFKIPVPKFIDNILIRKYLHYNRNFKIKKNSSNPEVSIIIPIYNNVRLTLECIKSIRNYDIKRSYEIIIVDDASADLTEKIISTLPGVKYIRNGENLGFIRSCNKGSLEAAGNYLLFLNNDTVVRANWLEALVGTFEEHDSVGLVGSKLIFPNGRLQEAGGIIWRNASAWNWHRNRNPSHPASNYVRDVDYVTGASMMIPRTLFEQLGRFDERYQHSYYEDTDLAMAVRKAGYRVLYQPLSVVVHHEGASSGNDLTKGAKRYQSINQRIFHQKWREQLKHHFEPPQRAADRLARGHILIVDEVTPMPDHDSGSIDMYNIIKILVKLGYRVHFIPNSNFSHNKKYTEDLQNMGVECIFYPFYTDINAFLSERGDSFDIILISRITVARNVIDLLKDHCPSAKLIFYTVDLHFLRSQREAELSNDPEKVLIAQQTREAELRVIDAVDIAIVLSETEKQVLMQLGKSNIRVIPLIRDFDELGSMGRFEHRKDVLFIGGYDHDPNIDAVEILVHSLWPAVRKMAAARNLPPITLHIYGSKMPPRFHDFECTDVRVHGYVEDLSTAFEKIRLSVAPLRYGAGLKGKLATSFGFGVPVIGSPVAFEGVHLQSTSNLCVSTENPEEFAELLVDLYDDETRWNALSREVREYSLAHYSFSKSQALIAEVISELMAA